MIDPCIRCVERDRCKGMNQPCKFKIAYNNWKRGCKKVTEHAKKVNKRIRESEA